MAHFITEGCTGCSVCGRYCPASAIVNSEWNVIARVKPKEIPRAKVIRDEKIAPAGRIA